MGEAFPFLSSFDGKQASDPGIREQKTADVARSWQGARLSWDDHMGIGCTGVYLIAYSQNTTSTQSLVESIRMLFSMMIVTVFCQFWASLVVGAVFS